MKLRLAIGLVAALALPSAANAANLITNGGFETGDLTGWTSNQLSFPIYTVTTPVQEGSYAAQIAGFKADVGTPSQNALSQTVATTAGQNYSLSFWRYQDADLPSGFDVSWNGVSLFSETDTGFLPYTNFTTTVLGTGSDSLVFTAYNDPAYTYLDNVSLTAVPEPATWAMLMLGFGAIGWTLRGSRRALSSAAV